MRILFLALLIGAKTMAQTITVNGTPMLVSDDISFPFWLESGSSVSPEVPVSSISVLEFNIVPNNNGNDMVFNQVISVTEGQTVPEGKTWKVESILMENQEFVIDSSNTSLDSAFVASMIAEALSSSGNNSSYQPIFSLECVEAGISPMCSSLGLDINYDISSPDNYTYEISPYNDLEGNYSSVPHWRKFEIIGLNISPGQQIRFKHNSYYSNPSSTAQGQFSDLTPLIEDGRVYFYMYAEMNASNYDQCISSENLSLLIPLSHALNTSYVNGSHQWNGTGSLSDFEIFYPVGGSYSSTGIIFNCN